MYNFSFFAISLATIISILPVPSLDEGGGFRWKNPFATETISSRRINQIYLQRQKKWEVSWGKPWKPAIKWRLSVKAEKKLKLAEISDV